MSFRRKILFSQLILLLALLSILLPLLSSATKFIRGRVPIDRVENFVSKLSRTSSRVEMIHLIDTDLDLQRLRREFNRSTMLICTFLLVINAILIMFVIHRVMRPVQQIMDAIRHYKEGKEEFLEHITLKEAVPNDEFTNLSSMINSLTGQIRKQIAYLTRQKEETEEILESIGEGIIASDPSARVIFANRSACRILGVTKEKILRQTLDSVDVANSDLLKICHELIVHALQTAETATHTWVVKENGTFYHDLISTPLIHKDGALLVLQDKTSDYRILELGKDFIANASHELKTPITIIRGFAETLQDLPDLSKEMLHEITEKIVKTCIRLDKLVRSLLTLNDIEHLTEARFAKFDLFSTVENSIQSLLSMHPEVKVKLHSEIDSAHVLGDMDLFELAARNILENAVKYSPEPAVIDVFIEPTEDTISLKFKDQGIGISEEDLPQIFERFYTVDKARSRKKGGAGLGLSIVKTIVKKHRGHLAVDSELNKGSTFKIILPKVNQ